MMTQMSKALLEERQEMFHAFMKGTTYTCIGIAILLTGMWFFLL